MGRPQAESLASVIVTAIKTALAPVIAQQAELARRVGVLEPIVPELRERVASIVVTPGPAGPPGPPGADGFTCDELIAVQDPTDERLVTLAFRRGETTKTIGTLRFTTPRYRGTYEQGKGYVPGDQVTHGGSMWHCYTATSATPGDGAPGWTLVVKRGRDARARSDDRG